MRARMVVLPPAQSAHHVQVLHVRKGITSAHTTCPWVLLFRDWYDISDMHCMMRITCWSDLTNAHCSHTLASRLPACWGWCASLAAQLVLYAHVLLLIACLRCPSSHIHTNSFQTCSLRAAYGTDNLCNALHGSKTPDVAAKEVEFFFPGSTFEDPSPLTSGAEWTLGLVKPDATAAGKADEIKLLAEMNGFTIIAAQKMQLTRARAEEFYAEHYGKEFFPKLVDFMTSGPIWALCLSRRNAIKGWRELMGPTNVFKAREEAPRR